MSRRKGEGTSKKQNPEEISPWMGFKGRGCQKHSERMNRRKKRQDAMAGTFQS